MPLHVALPIALGLIGAVAITVILVEVIPRVLEEREKKNSKKVKVRAGAVSGSSERPNDGRMEGYSTGSGRDWGYEVRNRKSRKTCDEEDEHRLLLKPIITDDTTFSPQHILANPSDFEISSPDTARQPPRTPFKVEPLISIDEATPPALQDDSTSPTSLPSPPLVPAPSTASASSFFELDTTPTVSKEPSLFTLRPPSPPTQPASVIDHPESLSTAASSAFSSPLLVDHSLEGSPSFSDDFETFTTPVQREGEDSKEAIRDGQKRERSETLHSGSASEDGDWFRLSDDEDDRGGVAAIVKRVGAEGEQDEPKNVTEEWERVGRERDRGSGLGLGLVEQ